MAAVPCSLQDRDHHVVHDQEEGACKIDRQVGLCFHVHALRRLHDTQQYGRYDHAEDCHQGSADQSHTHRRMDRVKGPVFISCSDEACNDHAGSVGESPEETDQKKSQSSGGTDCGQGVRPQIVADDQ